MSTPRPSEADVEALSDLSALIRDYLIDEVDATFPGFHATALTSRIASYWLAARDAEREREVAEAEVRGQMRHITAEVVRGDQSLGEQEDLIADLRARLSHVEAERDAAHKAGYWVGYGEGKEEAETRDLNYDDTTARAEAAERALADLRGEVKALADAWAAKPDYRGYYGDRAHDLRALLPRDDAAGAGGAG